MHQSPTAQITVKKRRTFDRLGLLISGFGTTRQPPKPEHLVQLLRVDFASSSSISA